MASRDDQLTRRDLLWMTGGAAMALGASGLLPDLAMAVGTGRLQEFSTPADWNDFRGVPNGTALFERLRQQWSRNVNQWTNAAITGNPWSSDVDSPRSFYFNPLHHEVPLDSPVKLVEWIAFPNRITTYLGKPRHLFTQDQLFELADNGRLANGTPLPAIPREVCPYIGSTPMPTMSYGPPGPRGWQDEYCEWAVGRDAAGKIKRVMFTCENAEYWFALWRVSPQRVVEIYRARIGRPVKLDDLLLRGEDGKPVRDHRGEPVYNPLNKWNASTALLPDSGGAMHLTSPPNSLPAEIALGAAATLPRLLDPADANPQGLQCCTNFGQSFRHSDPHIGFTINEAVNALNMRITICDPVGLYIQVPDFENIELPSAWINDGLAAEDFWRLERGYPGLGLHAEFRAPRGYEGLDLSEIRIAGRSLRWGSQIASTFQIGLRGVLIAPDKREPSQRALSCPTAEDPAPDRAAPYQLLDCDVMKAFIFNDSAGVSSLAAPVVARGQTLENMALITSGTQPDTAITFLGHDGQPARGIKVTTRNFIENQNYHVAGNTGAGTYNVFVIDIEVGPDAPTGQLDLRLDTFNTAAPDFLTVVDAGGAG